MVQKFVNKQESQFLHMWALQLWHAVVGGGELAALIRQNFACALMTYSALDLQEEAWARMLEMFSRNRAGRLAREADAAATCLDVANQTDVTSNQYAFLGLRFSWDEATQPLKPSLSNNTRSRHGPVRQAAMQAMTMVCELFCVCIGVIAGGAWAMVKRDEFWLTPLKVLAETSANYLLEVLLVNLPFLLNDYNSIVPVLNACD